ncbi:adenylate/guanylate cyclase domain-containing protein [Sulfitobacter sp. JB4-11]|uniref:adenylate/guanylate cyclase domain-containing protein n=1 Tax=Sulfitobacter rhodophyticola TaxID=3238304 RepID=UPI0035191345
MQDPTEHTVWRDDPRVAELNRWITSAGLSGRPHLEMLEAYCQRLVSIGVPLMRANVTVNALHPVYGNLGFDWHDRQGAARHEYGHTSDVNENWIKSPFYYMLTEGLAEYRERLCDDDTPSRFPLLAELKPLGASDYFATATLFGDWNKTQLISPDTQLEGSIMSWMSHGPAGFSDQDISLIRTTFPALALALRASSNRQTAVDLLGIYLGRDAGRRVLSGEIKRGSTQWIDAVICYFDLAGFTNMSQQVAGEDLIAMLNDYFGLVVSGIEAEGGNVLKFMGDGLLAIFDRAAFDDAPDRAITSVRALQDGISALNSERETAGQRTFDYTIALHAGPVLYGNIGADERLDFTVIGPEVNLAARIGGMHKSLGQPVIISQTVARDVTRQDCELISLGRYMLRGVETPQELFTIYAGDP